MKYRFDRYGWYNGTTDDSETKNVTVISPVNQSIHFDEGVNRSNWTGNEWIELPYKTPYIPVVKPAVPDKVTMRQARLALLNAGLYTSVNTTINNIPDIVTRTAAQIEWEYALFVARNATLITTLIPLLGLTEEQVDDLFIFANNIPD